MNRQTLYLSPKSEAGGGVNTPFSLAPKGGAAKAPAATPADEPPTAEHDHSDASENTADSAPAEEPAPKSEKPKQPKETKAGKGDTKPPKAETKAAAGETKKAKGDTKSPKPETPAKGKPKASAPAKPSPASKPKAAKAPAVPKPPKAARSFADHAAAILAHAGREMTAREISKAIAEKDRGGAGAAAKVHAAIQDEMGKRDKPSRFKRGKTPNHFVFVAPG